MTWQHMEAESEFEKSSKTYQSEFYFKMQSSRIELIYEATHETDKKL